jgi:hypothetical protein
MVSSVRQRVARLEELEDRTIDWYKKVNKQTI